MIKKLFRKKFRLLFHRGVHQQLKDLGTKVILLDASNANETDTIASQVSRLFTASLVKWDNLDNMFLLILDVNIWPIDANFYEVPHEKNIAVLDSDCCGSFIRDGVTFQRYSMHHIGMSANLWMELMRSDIFPIQNAADIMEYIRIDIKELGLPENASKSIPIGIPLDQQLMGLRITHWIRMYGDSCIGYQRRNLNMDRLGRSDWHIPENLQGIKDVQLVMDPYNTSTWEQVRPLIGMLFSKKEVQEFDNYRNQYIKLIGEA